MMQLDNAWWTKKTDKKIGLIKENMTTKTELSRIPRTNKPTLSPSGLAQGGMLH
jgi:hypothetical protein